jgi:hypothetical protein
LSEKLKLKGPKNLLPKHNNTTALYTVYTVYYIATTFQLYVICNYFVGAPGGIALYTLGALNSVLQVALYAILIKNFITSLESTR